MYTGKLRAFWQGREAPPQSSHVGFGDNANRLPAFCAFHFENGLRVVVRSAYLLSVWERGKAEGWLRQVNGNRIELVLSGDVLSGLAEDEPAFLALMGPTPRIARAALVVGRA